MLLILHTSFNLALQEEALTGTWISMAKKQQVEFLHPNVLLVITPKGIILELYTPIRAEVIREIGNLPKGTKVYIDAILKSDKYKILYCISGRWYPYNYLTV